ncbi:MULTISPECIES: ABC transporter substrate-binding protein [Sutcliffiella]|uniref:ABC transporter substrate-binding protein n=1 Tax=Sutcliffiella cohnii TaxID=33932 RepID=A0A223KR46_9BACI|nr:MULTISPECIES: ABC transporter substrate-binding protein [Sutcliffiella]AST91793.1 ABC transporter substrate-binding protein [Sutcliffiella cohnii]MED4018594.1 ABC transporter substrate-binding protein [Sutcliffiella cohnii]WBL13011.1 ABC transporter substrate-binding protein [Sutcliffiella sp. NC1]
MKKISMKLLVLILASAIVLAGCNSSTTGNNDEVVIGVTQIVEHPSLDAAFDGFKKALEDNGYKDGENVKYDVQIAQGEQSNSVSIANNFVADKVDLIFANSTPSAQTALQATKEEGVIPVLFTSVTDPVGAGLIEAFDKPGANITGTSDNHPESISNTIEFMINELNVKKIGVLYNAGEQNSIVQVEAVEEVAKNNGAEIVTASVSTSAEVKQAAESLIGRVDAIYVPTDNTVVSAFQTVVTVANEQKLPLFAGELDSMEQGAVAASGFSYYDLGYQTGLMAVQILKGEKKPSDIPAAYPESFKLVINKAAAEAQGVELKDSWKDIAEIFEGN